MTKYYFNFHEPSMPHELFVYHLAYTKPFFIPKMRTQYRTIATGIHNRSCSWTWSRSRIMKSINQLINQFYCIPLMNRTIVHFRWWSSTLHLEAIWFTWALKWRSILEMRQLLRHVIEVSSPTGLWLVIETIQNLFLHWQDVTEYLLHPPSSPNQRTFSLKNHKT